MIIIHIDLSVKKKLKTSTFKCKRAKDNWHDIPSLKIYKRRIYANRCLFTCLDIIENAVTSHQSTKFFIHLIA